MRGLRDKSGWCFCAGGGKSERVKRSIFSGKSPAMAAISGGGTGFLIHRNLLLTTHANIPSVGAAEAAEVRVHRGRVLAHLVPHRFLFSLYSRNPFFFCIRNLFFKVGCCLGSRFPICKLRNFLVDIMQLE